LKDLLMTLASIPSVAQASPTTCSYLDDDWRWRYARGACLRLSSEPQALFDDYLVEDTFNLRRVLNAPRKHPQNPILVPDQPWEWAQGHCNVLFDPQDELFKMWYTVHRADGGIRVTEGGRGHTYLIGYATSPDGISWEKPPLDMVRFEGRRTNLLTPGRHKMQGFNTSLSEDEPDPNRRFMMTYKDRLNEEQGECILQAYSPDGLHWQTDPEPLFYGCNDGGFQRIYDPQRKHWLLYRRAMTRAVTHGYEPWHNLNRRPAVCIGDGLRNLSQPHIIRILDELDIDLADADGWYVWRWGDMFLGSLGVMDHFAEKPKREHLIFSRDGLTWQRFATRPQFVPVGEPGSWDAGETAVTQIMTCGPKTYIYYRGASGPQGDVARSSGLGLAWLPRDSWAAQVADERGGFLLTRRFLNEAQELAVNAKSTRKHGGVIIGEVLKPSEGRDHLTAQPYPGFSFADCEPNPYKGSSRHVMRWKGGSLGALRGKPVMIRFHLQHCALYTMTLETSP
jgi:hypothetical protein